MEKKKKTICGGVLKHMSIKLRLKFRPKFSIVSPIYGERPVRGRGRLFTSPPYKKVTRASHLGQKAEQTGYKFG